MKLTHWCVLIAAAVLVPSAASFAGFLNIGASITPLTGTCAWGDYDKDGDLDLAVAGSDARTKYAKIYRNDAGTFTDIGALLPAVSNCALAWGDCDNDGDLDLAIAGQNLVGAAVTKLYICASGTFTESTTASFIGAYDCSMAWGDYDRDGLLDLVVAGMGDAGRVFTRIHHNNGDGTYTYISAGISGVRNGCVAWGDADNDGMLDLAVTGTGTSPGRVFHNNGDGTFTAAGTLSSLTSSSLAWGDYDNDGDLDIAQAGAGLILNSAYTRIYTNDGAGSFTLNSSASFTGVKNPSLAWGDCDNDGDVDLACCGLSGNGAVYYTKIYTNNGNGTFADAGYAFTGMANGAVAWGDYDADKRLDLAFIGQTSAGYFAAIYQNIVSVYNTAPNAPATNGLVTVGLNGEATFTWSAASDTQTPAGGLSYNIRIGTWAGGENVVGSMSSLSGTTIYRRVPAIGNAQKNLSVTINGLQPSTNYKWAVQAIDSTYQASTWSNERTFNTLPMISGRVTTAKGVPAPGILVDAGMGYTSTTDANGYYQIFLFKYFTGTVAPAAQGIASEPPSRSFTSLTAHQLNQDFVISWAGSFTEVTGPSVYLQDPCLSWVDFDRDGDFDLLTSGLSLQTPIAVKTLVYRNTAGVFADASVGLPGTRKASPKWADFNSDGYIDLAMQWHDGYVPQYWIRKGVNGTAFTDLGFPIDSIYAGAMAWADWDSDGDVDLIVLDNTYAGWQVRVCKQTAGTFAISDVTVPVSNGGRLYVMDIDNDGDLDLSVGNTPYRNDGGTFTSAGFGLPATDFCVWADYDSDGDWDFATEDGVYRNDGWTFTSVAGTIHALSEPAWGDYDDDGDLDLAYGQGYPTNDIMILRTDPGGVFTPVTAYDGKQATAVAWGDYDNDGDLDLAVERSTGVTSVTWMTSILRNDGGIPHQAPSAPGGLSATQTGLDVAFTWDAAYDAQTPSSGMTYNLRVGTTPGACDVCQPVVADPSAARMLIPAPGSQGEHRARTIRMRPGTYYWSVQSVDSTFVPSPWSAEQSITVTGVSISGKVAKASGTPLAGAVVSPDSGGLPEVTDSSGNYTMYVPAGWTGTVTPSAPLYSFSPSSLSFTNVTSAQTGKNFTALPFPVISGHIYRSTGAPYIGVTVRASGVTESCNTGSDGAYQLIVPYDWSGTITPEPPAGFFIPANRSLSNVRSDTSGFNFTATGLADIGAGLPGGFHAAWADWDIDSDQDLLCGPDACIYRNTAGVFTQSTARVAANGSNNLDWGDANNDGFPDLSIGDSIYQSDGLGGVTCLANTGMPYWDVHCTKWADIDNDGRQDLIQCGFKTTFETWIWHNNGDGTFTQVDNTIPGMRYSSLAVGDYDADGDVDIAVQGIDANNQYIWQTRIYRNNGSGIFTDIGLGLDGCACGSAAWGDFDNDGDLDLAVAGARSWDYVNASYIWKSGFVFIYRYDGNDQFTKVSATYAMRDAAIAWGDMDNNGYLDLWMAGDTGREAYDPNTPGFRVLRNLGAAGGSYWEDSLGLVAPSLALADFDNDGDLDVALAGKLANGTKLTRVCRNNVATQNSAPTAPGGLTHVVNGTDVTFSWSPGNDAEGGPAGLTYNLRVGTTPGGNQILSGLASSSGYRRVSAQGNAGRRLSWTLHGVTAGALYWSVQSIDNCYVGSPWASEQQVVTDGIPPTIVSAAVSPAMVKGGDPVKVTVDATDNVGVVSVTVDSTSLTNTSGTTWMGSVTALPGTGSHSVTITARDAAGNQTPVSRCYTTVRAISATTRSAPYVFPLYANSCVFTFWGRVAVIDTDSFTLDDGSGSLVKVILPGFTGLSSGQFAVVRGTLNPTASPPTLTDAIVIAVH